MTQRVLVTGASGFVGGALVAELRRRDFSVTAATRAAIAVHSGVRTMRVGDLGPATDWGDALRDCDTVVHCAARVHVMTEGASDPLGAFRRANVEGSVRLATQAAAIGVRRFVYISSIKVNGETTSLGHPFTENDAPAPVDAYGISKAEAEKQLSDLAARGAFELVIIRPPLVYGPGAKANFLAMTRWLARGFPLPLGSVTTNRRSLVALDNLNDLIVTCVQHDSAPGSTFLASDGNDLSTTELLRRTATALGTTPRLLPIPVALLRAGATLLGRRSIWQRLGGTLQCDITSTRATLGWAPPISVDEGLRRAVSPIRSAP